MDAPPPPEEAAAASLKSTLRLLSDSACSMARGLLPGGDRMGPLPAGLPTPSLAAADVERDREGARGV